MADSDKELVWDEEFMANLPPAAQRRIIRLTCQLLEAEICDQYGLPRGSLLEKLPNPLEQDLGPEEFREQAERAALSIEPLPRDEAALWELHQEKIQKEVEDGKESK